MVQVLVTGAGGFVGKSLVRRLLLAGFKVKVVSRTSLNIHPEGVTLIVADLTKPSSTLMEAVSGCDYIFHCAGEINNISMMRSLHVNGLANLLEAAIKCGNLKHWIQLSSVGVYGKVLGRPSGYREVNEKTISNPSGEYEVTKEEADRILLSASKLHQFTFSILRPSNIVGLKMPNNSFECLLRSIITKYFFFIGSTNSISNYVHVDDVVEALILCAKHPKAKNEIFNLSNDCKLSSIVSIVSASRGIKPNNFCIPIKLASVIVKCIPKFFNFPLSQSRINALISRTHYSTAKINEHLEFLPRHSIPEFAVKYLNESVEK